MKEKILKVINFLSEHESKIIFALVVVIVLGLCGIMSLTFIDHIDVVRSLTQ